MHIICSSTGIVYRSHFHSCGPGLSDSVVRLTKMCRPVGCRPVGLLPIRLSSTWFCRPDDWRLSHNSHGHVLASPEPPVLRRTRGANHPRGHSTFYTPHQLNVTSERTRRRHGSSHVPAICISIISFSSGLVLPLRIPAYTKIRLRPNRR